MKNDYDYQLFSNAKNNIQEILNIDQPKLAWHMGTESMKLAKKIQ